ncbi:MAG: 2-oxoacid:acceptor oxidoreductase family protein [Thermoprotei archaeon]
MLEEISLFGRGGQGVVTAGELLVSAAVKDGLYGQSIPFYGGERRGAPVRSDVRISDQPIYMHRRTYNPDIVAVFDPSLLEIMKVTEGLKEDGIVLVNSKQNVKVWKNTYVVDATDIAKELGLVIAGWPVVNTAMAGALVNLLKTVKLDALIEAIKETFPGKLGDLNVESAKLGYEKVRRVD